MLLTHDLIPAVREHVPGFAAMEATLTAWLNERSPVPVELFYAHGLRQSQKTLTSTGFAVHQDTEDFDFIEYSIVVKLTADERGEPRPQAPPASSRRACTTRRWRRARSASTSRSPSSS